MNPITRRPVVNLTLAVNYAIGGLDVRGFHVGNLLIHLLAALTLYGIVRRTLLSPLLKERFGHAASALALAAALIWSVHPLQTEAVTYLTQRTESLMGLFFLLTLYGAIRAASSPHPWKWYAATVAACALGMGCQRGHGGRADSSSSCTTDASYPDHSARRSAAGGLCISACPRRGRSSPGC